MTSQGAETTVERVVARVRESLLEIEDSYRQRGRSVAELDIDALAQRMAAVVPVPSPVNEHLGPFHRSEQVAKLLGVSRQAVHERSRKRTLLALQTVDGVWVYPSFQFDGRKLHGGLAIVLAEFASAGADPWAVAAWLRSPHAALAGATPFDALVEEQVDAARIAVLASDVARRWNE